MDLSGESPHEPSIGTCPAQSEPRPEQSTKCPRSPPRAASSQARNSDATGRDAPLVTAALPARQYNTRVSIALRPPCARLLIVICATVSCVLAIAGCGSASAPKTPAGSSPTTTTSSQHSIALRFAACMRSHGVANFADPASNGQGPSVRVDKRSPAFRTAQRACRTLQAELADVKPGKSRARQLRNAECMRAHGVPDYPDPLPGGGFRIPSTINTQSPAFIAASKACERT